MSHDYFYGTEPSQFLVAQRALLRPGLRALAVAEGEGRNAVYLAEQGLKVTAMDSCSEFHTRKCLFGHSLSVDRPRGLQLESWLGSLSRQANQHWQHGFLNRRNPVKP